MLLWRISNYADLTGAGGMLASARWHTAGRPIVYLAETPAGALLEVLVHLELDEAHRPATYQLLRIEAPDGIAVQRLNPDSLSPDWRTKESETQGKGDTWLRTGETALLAVPSAIVPETSNWLLNPRHPDATHLRITHTLAAPFDARLF